MSRNVLVMIVYLLRYWNRFKIFTYSLPLNETEIDDISSNGYENITHKDVVLNQTNMEQFVSKYRE